MQKSILIQMFIAYIRSHELDHWKTLAIKSTIFKVNLTVSDMNRQYYADHALVIARHPSETDLRMLVRIVAFALNANELLHFTKGLANADEPDLWQISLSGEIEHWIDLGQPADKRIRQSCSKSAKVSIYTYQKGAALPWFESIKDDVQRFKHLNITHLSFLKEAAIHSLIDRSMNLSCTVEDNQILLSNDADSVAIEYRAVK